MKTKIPDVCLALCLGLTAAVIGFAGCAWNDPAAAKPGPNAFQPTYRGDEHTPPVYTSPSTNTTPTIHN